MIQLIVFLIEIVLAAILGGILGYAIKPGRLKSHIQILILLTVGSAVFASAASGLSSASDGSARVILLAGIIIATGLFAASLVARESGSARRLIFVGAFWMAAAVGILIGIGSLIKAVLLTGLAYYVLRYLPGVLREPDSVEPAEEEDV